MTTKFYKLADTCETNWYCGYVLTEIDRSFLDKGMRGFSDVIRVSIIGGAVPGDFLWNSLCILIVSSKVLEVWEQFGGFETFPVVIEQNPSLVEYTGVAFLGRGGPFDPVRSRVVYSKCLNEEGKPAIMKIDGFYFDESKWDGSDLFTLDEFPCVKIVTERVVEAMRKAKVTHCHYVPLEESGYGYKK